MAQRINEQIGAVPAIEAKLHLRKISGEVFRADFVPTANDATLEQGGVAMITADHGNAEQMIAPDGGPWTAHTSNPVPFILVAGGAHPELRSVHLCIGGKLGDVSPTILYLLGLSQPGEMTGTCLIDQ